MPKIDGSRIAQTFSGNLPPISSLRAFEAATRHMNFTRAAEELAITQAAVSYQIRLLEQRLGVSLFIREPRRLLLTETGVELSIPVREAFDRLRSTFENFHEKKRSVLSVTAAETFAANWLVPRLGTFQGEHPSIAVRLEASNRVVDFSREKFDVGIRTGSGDWPGLTCHRLFPLDFTPVCTPSLLARLGRPKRPRDLIHMPLISPSDPIWKAWFASVGLADVDLDRSEGPDLGAQHLKGRAALADQGIAILSIAFFASELESGRLIKLFDVVADGGQSYWFVYPRHHAAMTKVRAFQSWITSQAAANRTGLRRERNEQVAS